MNKVLLALPGGAVFGAATSFLNAASNPYVDLGAAIAGTPAASAAEVVSRLLGAGWAWAALAIVVGLLARSPVAGAFGGTGALLAATAAYYLLDPVLRDEPFALHAGGLLVWGTASGMFGPLLGALGSCIRRPGPLGVLAALAVPVGATVEMYFLRGGPAFIPPTAAERGANWIVYAAAAACTALIVQRAVRRPRHDP